MFGINTKHNYNEFSKTLRDLTQCDVEIRIMATNHVHYGLTKCGICIMVLCFNNGELSFVPFKNVNDATIQNCEYISTDYAPSFETFADALTSISNLLYVK